MSETFRISAGIYRKESHTLKYSMFSSNRLRVEQLGNVKSMLHGAHELCDEGEPLSNEIELLGNAFIANGYHPKDIDCIISTYEHQKPDNNEAAEHRCDTICIPYVRGPSDLLRRQLAREGVNLIFKKGRTLRQFLFNGEPKKQTEEKMFVTEYPVSIVLSAILGKLLNGGMNKNPNTREVSKTRIVTTVSSCI